MIKDALKSTLTYYADSGIDVLTQDVPSDLKSQTSQTIRPSLHQRYDNTAVSGPKNISESVLPVHAQQEKQPHNADLENVTSLQELREAILSYEGLGLKKTAMNLVFGEGDPQADVMVIGEAPGAEEDKSGVPFVGQSGQLLDNMLAAINIARKPEKQGQKPCYVTNLINWRPPGNRTPTQEEVDLSLPFAIKHIELVEPKLVIIAGAVAAKAVLGRAEGISKLRGKIWDLPNSSVKVVATYHPSYLLRQPRMKRKAWADLLIVKEYLEGTQA